MVGQGARERTWPVSKVVSFLSFRGSALWLGRVEGAAVVVVLLLDALLQMVLMAAPAAQV